MALIHGRNTTTKQKTHFVVIRIAVSKRRSGTDGKETRPTGSPSWSMSGQTLGGDTWTILQKSTSPTQRQRYNNRLRSVNEDKQAPPLDKDQDTKMQRRHWLICRNRYDKFAEFFFSQKVVKHRLHNQLDPAMQRYLEWPSTKKAEYFAHSQPTSSSS